MPNDRQPTTPGAVPHDPYARPSLPNIPPPDDAGPPGRAMWCSDCRAPLKTRYFAMNTRPVCSKCKIGYEEQIARGTGSAATLRAALWGGGAALAGAVILAGVLMTVGAFGRILMAVGIGWAVGTAIKKANGGFPGVHYQILAAALTYFAIGLGSIAPVVRDVRQARTAFVADSVRGVRDDSARAALLARQREEAGVSGEEIAAPDEPADPLEAASPRRTTLQLGPQPPSNAAGLIKGGIVGRIVVAIVLIFSLPLISLFAFGGIYGAAITIFAFGFGMYKAWDLTSGGAALEVTGPHKVGSGPILPAY